MDSHFTEILGKRFYWNLSGLLKETEILIVLELYWNCNSQPTLVPHTCGSTTTPTPSMSFSIENCLSSVYGSMVDPVTPACFTLSCTKKRRP